MTAATLSPLPEDKQPLVARLVEGLDAPALLWLSGYLAGLAGQRQPAGKGAAATEPSPVLDAQPRLTVLYGSQTGNARRLAEDLGRRAAGAGLAVRVVRADAYATRELKHERLLYVVMSTQGDAEPPDDARAFVEFLAGARAPRLEALRYGVLGLGDSSYPGFCAIGRQLDERLAQLGAQRLFAAGEADVDLEAVAQPWLEQALQHAREQLKGGAPLATVTPLRTARNAPAWHRDQPFPAPVLLNQRITGRDSDRDVRHLELSLEGSSLRYAPGDALGVWPTQAPCRTRRPARHPARPRRRRCRLAARWRPGCRRRPGRRRCPAPAAGADRPALRDVRCNARIWSAKLTANSSQATVLTQESNCKPHRVCKWRAYLRRL